MLVLPERERTKKGAIGVETKGVTCKIPLDLHNQISEEIRETESTMSKFIEMIIREHYEKGANRIMEKGRTLAFQVSEELFQRVKEYLENYEKAYHRRLTQKEFVIGLIEQALEEAEEEFEAARAAEHEEQAENGWEAAETAESDEDEEVPDDEESEDWDEENGETEGLSADEETTGNSWEPAENTETDEGEDDEDTTPESWNRDEEEETEPDDDIVVCLNSICTQRLRLSLSPALRENQPAMWARTSCVPMPGYVWKGPSSPLPVSSFPLWRLLRQRSIPTSQR